ncbi:ThiF family adenylyltransferase [Polycladidibacter hongkongensis]|uniref:ThiF family adenylyltransferase n=1 Tax=Polycladidibacter hongkongensis TaxID=1647556 RepID=UPI00244AF606|nr:ThiF family adenylyltransferase [Pseudovibrio hongkongensis]
MDLGQARQVHDIQLDELVAIKASVDQVVPSVYPLRSNFPQNFPHLNAIWRGERRSLCLYDVKVEEIEDTYSPLYFIERIRWWFKESAYGRLHGEDQPLDPALAQSFFTLLLPSQFSSDREYSVVRTSDNSLAPILVVPRERRLGMDFGCIALETEPVPHGQMLDLPRTFSNLVEVYEELGVNIAELVGEQILDIVASNDSEKSNRLECDALIVVRTPLLRENKQVGGFSTRAYLGHETSLGQLGEALAVVAKHEGSYRKLFVATQPNGEFLKKVELLPVNVQEGFTPEKAAACSGLSEPLERHIALIGAGALGSQVALSAARMGAAKWSIFDPDFLFPHNLARHIAIGSMVGSSKADLLSREINDLFQDNCCTAYSEVVGPSIEEASSFEVIKDADMIVDTSASLRVPRWLSTLEQSEKPQKSCFLTPSGSSLVLMEDDPERQLTLSDLEAYYYWLLYSDDSLNDHLAFGDNIHIGSCRDASVTIPQSSMGIFANIIAARVVSNELQGTGQISFWNLGDDHSIESKVVTIAAFKKVKLGDWVVCIGDALQNEIANMYALASNQETGGILLGSVDLRYKTIYLTGALPAPPDSTSATSYFDRGGEGVWDSIDKAAKCTQGHLVYVGEWHTHPVGFSSAPSSLDDKLISWIGDKCQFNLRPGIMLICGSDGLRVRVISERKKVCETVI